MGYLAKPDEKSIIKQLRRAIINVKGLDCENFYNELANIYNWRQVAERTEKVYDYVMQIQTPNVMSRVKSAFTWGSIVGWWALFYLVMEAICIFIVDIFYPESDIDVCKSFNTFQYNEKVSEFGDHQLYVDMKHPEHLKRK